MSLRLERIPGATLVRAALTVALTVALAAAMVAVSPEAAEARTGDKSTPSVVVRPGDSLWSISEERLGPNASPRRVMKGAERIHALNRERIGADPDMVLAGQELLVPPAMSDPPTGAAVSARKAVSPRGSAGKETPRRAPRQGSVLRSEISLEELDRMLGAHTQVEENLPDPRAAAPAPAVRTVASRDAQPRSFFGFPADVSAEGRRRLLGLGIMALTLVVAALAAARAGSAARRRAGMRAFKLRKRYGSPYAAFEPLAGPEDASSRVPQVRGQTASSGSPANAGVASEGRFNHTDHSAVARAKRARVLRKRPLRKRPLGLRQQPLRLRARGLRQPVRTRAQGRPSSGRRGATARAIRKEWQPGAALVGALGGMPLRPRTSPVGDLAGLKPLLEGALGELRRLERLRGLSREEKTRREALEALVAAVERAE